MTYFNREERFFFDSLEKPTEDIVDEVDQIFVGLVAGQRFLVREYASEKIQCGNLKRVIVSVVPRVDERISG